MNIAEMSQSHGHLFLIVCN
uniref:Uncharacterized protein n=1 Tax=Anguilla anguilla TaxID=7936 RepID=A0A0E9W664_ANGAN